MSSYRVGRLRGRRRRRKTTESTMRPKSAMRAVSMCGRRGVSLTRKRQWRTSAPIEEGKLRRMDTAIMSCGRIESNGIERELPLSWNALRRQVLAYELMIVRKFRFWFLARAVFLRPSLFFLSCLFIATAGLWVTFLNGQCENFFLSWEYTRLQELFTSRHCSCPLGYAQFRKIDGRRLVMFICLGKKKARIKPHSKYLFNATCPLAL